PADWGSPVALKALARELGKSHDQADRKTLGVYAGREKGKGKAVVVLKVAEEDEDEDEDEDGWESDNGSGSESEEDIEDVGGKTDVPKASDHVTSTQATPATSQINETAPVQNTTAAQEVPAQTSEHTRDVEPTHPVTLLEKVHDVQERARWFSQEEKEKYPTLNDPTPAPVDEVSLGTLESRLTVLNAIVEEQSWGKLDVGVVRERGQLLIRKRGEGDLERAVGDLDGAVGKGGSNGVEGKFDTRAFQLGTS
ncbi:hypothetical protein M427DRAFT_156702, partial [Gonapodya prolifera JEL478]